MEQEKDEERDAIYKDYDDYVSWKLDEGDASEEKQSGPSSCREVMRRKAQLWRRGD